MSLFGESREAVENRFALMRKTHDLQMQERGELVRGLQNDVDRLKHSLELALSASRRWERMHDREHQERKWLENRVALLEAEKAFHRLEVVPDVDPVPLDIPYVSLTPEEFAHSNAQGGSVSSPSSHLGITRLAQHDGTVDREGLELLLEAGKRVNAEAFEGDPRPGELSQYPISVVKRGRGRPRKDAVETPE